MTVSARFLAAVLLSAATCAAENLVVGKWNCMNKPDTGDERPWTLLVREAGADLTGLLTDGEAEIPLSQVTLDSDSFSFRFEVNGKPYQFKGKADAKTVVGRYSGEEATGALHCEKPAT